MAYPKKSSLARCALLLALALPMPAVAQLAGEPAAPAQPTGDPVPPEPPPPVVTPSPALLPPAPPSPPPPAAAAYEHWYDRIQIRGYTQVRYNRLGSDISSAIGKNDDYVSDGDKTIGGKNGFSLRRARLVIYGNITEHFYLYLQPELAGSVGDAQNFAQLRDLYGDVSFDQATRPSGCGWGSQSPRSASRTCSRARTDSRSIGPTRSTARRRASEISARSSTTLRPRRGGAPSTWSAAG
jgi:hypothetical protein